MNIRRILLLAALTCLPLLSHAHKPSDSYLSLNVADRHVEGQWAIALRDLDFAIGLDQDGDSAITWNEVLAKQNDIERTALSRLVLSQRGATCQLGPTTLLADNYSDGAYAVLRFVGNCDGAIDTLDIRYTLLFDIDPQHKGLLKIDHAGRLLTGIFSAERPSQSFSLNAGNRLNTVVDYTKNGVWHIWIGFDHILFLLSLLLPAVLLCQNRQWQPSPDFKSSLVDVLKIVTAFTVAHSMTLTLAALQIVSLPSRLVESAIAASVALAAVNNVIPLFRGRRWLAALIFGLVHGFGFASVLTDLGLPRSSLLLALVSFNVGVELGQLGIVLLFLPLAHLLRTTLFYRRVLLPGGSVAISVIGTVWLLERALDWKLMTV
ncbi:HupE/UreJ family protein [Herbaspirillum sp. ST 5-3]|uniref:HupE/UreJ family protein n=1 Tax=Oxalobacteraceae TaxID=75682 RepID=UPI0010A448B8|nr:HupE/UreJ family protein [Herbaspirillum sp. ST 5-3]